MIQWIFFSWHLPTVAQEGNFIIGASGSDKQMLCGSVAHAALVPLNETHKFSYSHLHFHSYFHFVFFYYFFFFLLLV